MLLFEHPLHESARFGQCRNRFPHTSTRPSVRTHRGRHPARSGRPWSAHRKMAHRRVFQNTPGWPQGCSETPPGHLITLGDRQFPARGQDAPHLCCPRPLDPGQPAGFIQGHPPAGRVSSVVRAAVACSWCLVVLFLLATGLVSRRGHAAAPHVACGAS